MTGTARVALVLLIILWVGSVRTIAHAGPPFPILSDRIAGPYLVSVWTDPDTTDDGTPGGQFWVMLQRAGGDDPLPPDTRARVAIGPLDRPGPEHAVSAEPVRGDVRNQFAALVMDHEGRFTVRVDIESPLGAATLTAQVDATYDLRPAPYLLALYLAPFLLVGLLWGRVLIHRRSEKQRDARRTGSHR
jgi:hypothetical protein